MSSCPFCGLRDFRTHAGRPEALCGRCGSLERHRALADTFAKELGSGRKRAALDVAPYSRLIFGEYLEARRWQVTRIDKWRSGNPHDPRNAGFIDAEVDLTDMRVFDSGLFDLVVLQHVIEEIEDYERALGELARVLSVSGMALLEIPWRETRSQSQPQSPDHFGNVWTFGRDLPDALCRAFASVETVRLSGGGYAGTVFVCRTRRAY